MLDKLTLESFCSSFKYLTDKAINYLITEKWAADIDRYTRILVPNINDKEVHFELTHIMTGRLLQTIVFSWDEINSLPD